MNRKRPKCPICSLELQIGSCVSEYQGHVVHQDCYTKSKLFWENIKK